jgi:hypothetical protein
MEPEPGRPRSLGAEGDSVDAAAVFAVIEVCRAALGRDHPRAGLGRILRQTIWSMWEQPRLPGDLVSRKYPKEYPWSAKARKSYKREPKWRTGGRGLVIEHVYPRKQLIADLLADDNISPETTRRILADRIMAAVITVEEDRKIGQRDDGGFWPDYEADPWRRYRGVGIRLARFRPVVAVADEAS